MATPNEYLEEFEKLDIPTRQETIIQTVKTLSDDKKTETLINAGKDLSNADKQIIATAFNPTQPVMDKIWLAVVYAFVFVLVGVFLGMMTGWMLGKGIEDKFITIFTTASAFLAGLLAPSPGKN